LTSTKDDAASGILSETFLSFPGDVNCNVSLRFSPSKGTIDPHSLKADLDVDSVHVSVDNLRSLLSLLRDGHQSEPTYSPSEPLPSTLPISASDTLSAKTPMSPFIEALRSVRNFVLRDSIQLHERFDCRRQGDHAFLRGLSCRN
jgi:hypothetical protein